MSTRNRIENPVVRGVNPDPSACRVGDDFFLATSTLEFWPGIPIRHSTDLVHWRIIGHAVTRPAQYRRDGRPGELKLYAPTLRHDGHRFHLACTNVASGQGNFIVSATDPSADWSDALWVDSDAFDPSLTFADGTVYYTRRTVVPGREGSGPVVQAELDVTTGALLTDTRVITPGEAGYRSNDIEGPHLYRIGDWWYLFSAEGGTWKGHMQTVARSRSPWGPFEGSERNPVLTHRHRVGHPIQSTGHAELVDDHRGNWWALFLGTRHHGARSWHHLGRETFLAPVEWNDGWPVIGVDGTTELELEPSRALPRRSRDWAHATTAWTRGWSTRERPLTGVSVEAGEDGTNVALPASDRDLDDGGAVAAAFVSQTETDATFSASVVDPPPAPARSGLTAYAAPAHHYDLTAAATPEGSTVTLRKRVGDMITQTSTTLQGVRGVELSIVANPDRYCFSARAHRTADAVADPWTVVGTGEARLLSAETSQTYSGVRFGVFSTGAAVRFIGARHRSEDSAAGGHG